MSASALSHSSLPACRRSAVRPLLWSCLACLGLGGPAQAGFLVVADGDFASVADAGMVGGGALGASGTDVPIGAGHWHGTFFGVLGLLAPPRLEIDSVTRSATVSDVLGIDVLSILDNGGYFSQTLASSYQPHKRYTLAVDLHSNIELDLPLLAAAGVGSALRAGSTVLASTATAAAGAVRIDSVDATTRRVALTYDTGASAPQANGLNAASPIDVQLFDAPQGLLDGELMESAEFSAVKLAQTTIPPAGSTLTVSGGGSQAAAVGGNFPSALIATVRDAQGNPVPDVLVTFAAPVESQASAVLHAGSENGNVVMAFSDANGQVQLSATANALAGCYSVHGSLGGAGGEAVFNLRNFSSAAAQAYLRSHPQVNELPQDSVYCNGFE